jgi:hypothetical protein
MRALLMNSPSDDDGDLRERLQVAVDAHRNLASPGGESIDAVYTARGFASVAAFMDRDRAIGGASASLGFSRLPLGQDELQEARGVHDEITKVLVHEYEYKSLPRPIQYFDRIRLDSRMHWSVRRQLLLRFFPNEFAEAEAPWVPRLREAALLEQESLCRVFPLESDCSLIEPDQDQLPDVVTTRKNAFNACMLDAFGSLGFSQSTKRRGVHDLHKVLVGHYAIAIEPEGRHLERGLRGVAVGFPIEGQAGHATALLPVNSDTRVSLVGVAPSRQAQHVVSFIATGQHYWAHVYQCCWSKRSLEVCVRAAALWHELTVRPLESVLLEQLN